MSLRIMQNIYPASWFYLTWHCYVRSMFVKHNLEKKKIVIVAVVVYLFIVAVFFNWYQLDCKFFYRAM